MHPTAGSMLKEWRARRHRSQMDLAYEVGVSPRHLSFVETGRARASAELLIDSLGSSRAEDTCGAPSPASRLPSECDSAEHLEVPLRERNALLLAAGYAPRYGQRALDDPAMARVRESLQRVLDAHDPYPGVVIDRYWNVVAANQSALVMTSGLPPELLGPPLNVYRVSLHPDGLAARTLNLHEWGPYLLGQLRRTALLTGDPVVAELLAEVSAYQGIADLEDDADPRDPSDPPLLVPVRLAIEGGELSMFTTLTRFGTPQDVTLDELAVELFYPADDRTESLLRG